MMHQVSTYIQLPFWSSKVCGSLKINKLNKTILRGYTVFF